MATAATAGAMILAIASPAQAAPTERARWDMADPTALVDTPTDSVNNNGTTFHMALTDGFYDFNGVDSIAGAPTKSNLNPGINPIKLEVRLNARAAPVNGQSFDILRKGTSRTATGYYKIELRGTSTGMNAACIFKDKNKVAGTAVTPVPIQNWLTVTCTRTATTVTLAVNGVTKKTITKTVGSITNTERVFIGGKGDQTDAFAGLMDYASITIG